MFSSPRMKRLKNEKIRSVKDPIVFAVFLFFQILFLHLGKYCSSREVYRHCDVCLQYFQMFRI